MIEAIRVRCVATKSRLDPTLPPKKCPRWAKYGEWCRQHAESLGGWRLAPPDPDNYRGLAASFWVHYRCEMVGCRTVEPHEHGGGQAMRESSPRFRPCNRCGGSPDIHNTNRGAEFVGHEYS